MEILMSKFNYETPYNAPQFPKQSIVMPELPVVAVLPRWVGASIVSVRCPYCGRKHRHYAPFRDGIRTADCGKGEYRIVDQRPA